VKSWQNIDEVTASQYQNEDSAREYLESKLWPDGPFCPHCGAKGNSYKLESRPDSRNKLRKGVYKCGACRKPFTVTVGTIFEDSRIPLHKWLLGLHLMCSSKNSMSAVQLQRELKLGSYRAVWFMCHRIRWAMTQSPMSEALRASRGNSEIFGFVARSDRPTRILSRSVEPRFE
jgi:transposase-like protein